MKPARNHAHRTPRWMRHNADPELAAARREWAMEDHKSKRRGKKKERKR